MCADKKLFDNRIWKTKVNPLPNNPEENGQRGRFPSWLHRKLPRGGMLHQTQEIVKKYRLNTVCEEAKCPNRLECFSKKTATFLALGKTCTRSCGFCDIDFSKNPLSPEEDEPQRIALSAKNLGLKHVVITMVARDDLLDGGAFHVAKIIQALQKELPKGTIEILTSDFCGNETSLETVLKAGPDIFNHNIETVRRLSPRVRHKASYDRSLNVLRFAKGKVPLLKSGIMVGLGEEKEEVEEALRDLKEVGCDIITIGQYLQADHRKLCVKAFITPKQFKAYEDYGYKINIKHVYSGPFVRSSYNAALLKEKAFKAKEI